MPFAMRGAGQKMIQPPKMLPLENETMSVQPGSGPVVNPDADVPDNLSDSGRGEVELVRCD